MQSACTILYCQLWALWVYNILPHYLITGTIIGKKKLLGIEMCTSIISTISVRNISHCKKISATYYHKHTCFNSEVCHPCCVGTVTQKFCVLHVQSNTTKFHLVQWEYNYMFQPYRWAIFRL